MITLNRPFSRNRILSLWIVTLATLFAAVMRLARLESLPPPAWFDEVWFALRARELIETGQRYVFYETYFGGANAGLVYLTGMVQAAGIDTITSARWAIALAGVISVPLAYACFRNLTPRPLSDFREGETTGVLAAVFLAYTMFYVIITRVGMESGMAPAVALFVVWQVARAAYHRKASGWVFGGLALGLAQYNGLHARFVIPVAAYFLIDLALTLRGPDRRRVILGGLLMAGIAIVAALPLIGYFAQNPEWLTARAAVVTQPEVGSRLDQYLFNITQIAQVFSIEGSYDPKTTVPGIPLLDVVQSVGFYVGLAWSVWNLPRRRIARVLLAWLIIAALPGVLTDGPNLQRMVGIAAPLAGIVAVGWSIVVGWAGRILNHEEHKEHEESRRVFLRDSSWPSVLFVVNLFSAVLLLASISWHAYLVFDRWGQEPKLEAQFTAAPVTLAREAIHASREGVVYAERIPDVEDVIAWEYLFPGTPVTRLDLRKCLPMPHQRAEVTSYLVLTEKDNETAPRLLAAYPGAYPRTQGVDLWQDIAAWIEVPGGSEAPAPPHQPEATFDQGITLYGYDWSADTLHPGETLFLTLYWHAAEPISGDWTAFAHVGTGLEGSALIAQRDGAPCVGLYPTSQWHPGEVIPDSFAITLPPDAPPGEYPIAVGWYAYPSLERLALKSADQPLPDHRAIIGTIRVE